MQKLGFAPDAEKITLLRRAHFDLTGLPPTPAETEAFLADNAPNAYEKLIDRLLDSPHYGERWGRHWLDVAGYADSDGYSDADPPRGYAYKYRDYVIRSFNADKPFDRFITEQLAGDELAHATQDNPKGALADPQLREWLVATGFLRMGADGTATPAVADPGAVRNQVVADTIKILSTSLLGLSVGCAQCHDHRYDPIPQTDYYRLRAVIEPAYDWKNWRTPDQRLLSLYTDADRKKADEVEVEAKKLSEEKETKQKQYIDEAILPGALSVLTPPGQSVELPSKNPDLATSGRRLAFARWLTSGTNPLVARVLVNRVWQHHFGRGLVGTPSDFGVMGERPSHPELLDWLAADFVEHDWQLKRLHRLIMTASAYGLSSRRAARA